MKDKFGVELEAGQQVLYAYKSGNGAEVVKRYIHSFTPQRVKICRRLPGNGNGSVVYPSSLIVFQEVDTEDER